MAVQQSDTTIAGRKLRNWVVMASNILGDAICELIRYGLIFKPIRMDGRPQKARTHELCSNGKDMDMMEM